MNNNHENDDQQFQFPILTYNSKKTRKQSIIYINSEPQKIKRKIFKKFVVRSQTEVQKAYNQEAEQYNRGDECRTYMVGDECEEGPKKILKTKSYQEPKVPMTVEPSQVDNLIEDIENININKDMEEEENSFQVNFQYLSLNQE